MNISYYHGNLFTTTAPYLCHCISADFALGAGIAKTFTAKLNMRNKLRNAYPNYTYQDGDALLIDNVFNLVTKERYFHKPTEHSLAMSLFIMRNMCIKENINHIAMPRIGCGLDRLQWQRVLAVLIETFKDTDIQIDVYSL